MVLPRPRRVAIVWCRDAAVRRDATPQNSRFSCVFDELTAIGIGRTPWERRITTNGREVAYRDMLFRPGVTIACHLSASVAPIGMTKAGLPIGVRIVAPPGGGKGRRRRDGPPSGNTV